ncbi:MAG: acyl-CoA thioesterase [Actinobacteria bacterium]|nr:acyl-CoA thioesterase [Actinomycetota bacterium]
MADGGTTTGAPASIVIRRRVEWADVDGAGWYHNTAAFRFIEAAETSLLARLGLIHFYGRHPRVHVEADFLAPLRFHDVVDVEIRVAAVGRTSVTYDSEIRRGDEVAVQGRLVAVLLDGPGGEPAPWPDDARERFMTAGPQRGDDLSS